MLSALNFLYYLVCNVDLSLLMLLKIDCEIIFRLEENEALFV